MKRVTSIFLIFLLVLTFCSCNKDNSNAAKKRMRATAGMNTKTSSDKTQTQTVTDTGVLKGLTETHAKSNKSGQKYKRNVLLDLPRDNSNTIKIACVGDSITYGTLSSDSATKSYPSVLANLFKAKFGNAYSVKNYGHAGAYVADFNRENKKLQYNKTDEYKQLCKDNPDVVVMMIGTNDIGYISNNSNISKFKNDFTQLIKSIKSLKSNPIIYICTPIVRYTSYINTINFDYLIDVELQVAREQGANIIDTYNITKQYFSSQLYETDGLHPNDVSYPYLAQTIFNGLVNGLTSYKKGEIKSTPGYVVYVDSNKGSYDSVGATANNPTSSFARAVELCMGGGTIVVSGPITPATTAYKNTVRVMITGENKGKITVTSIDPYNNTDYRKTNNAQIFMSSSMYLNGDYEFKNVTFNTIEAGVKFVCNYHNVTMGSGVSCIATTGGYFPFIVGHDVASEIQRDSDLNCNDNCNIVIKSGTFSYLRGGNFRSGALDASSKYPYGTVKAGKTLNIDISGGTFSNQDPSNEAAYDARLCSFVGQNAVENGAKINVNITGGTFKGSLFAVPRMNPYFGNVPTIKGDISINISDGVFLGSKLNAVQTYTGSKNSLITGAYNLNISNGAFASSGKKEILANGASNAKLTLCSKTEYLKTWATIEGFVQ